MPSLPTLADEEMDLMREIEQLIASGADEDEIKEKIDEKLSLEENAEEKLQGYYHILRELKEHERACENEIEVLEESKERAESAREGLEQNVKFYMEEVADTDELRSGTAHFRVNQVGGRRSLKTPGNKSDYPRETRKWSVNLDIDGSLVDTETHDEIMTTLREIARESGVNIKVRERLLKSRVREVMAEESDLVEYEPRKTNLKYD